LQNAPFDYAPRFAKALRGGEQGKDCGMSGNPGPDFYFNPKKSSPPQSRRVRGELKQ